MKLVTFSCGPGGPRRIGVLVGTDRVGDLRAAVGDSVTVPPDLLRYVQAGPQLHGQVSATLSDLDWPDQAVYDINDVNLHAPLRPSKVVGVGLNYSAHVEEASRSLDTDSNAPTRPVLFCKPSTAIVGPGEPVMHNARLTAQLDWECELAAVIGRTAFGVSREDALGYVFGYSVMVDVSARDQRRSGQWFFSKGQDSYAPFGPVLVTADEIPDPQDLDVALHVSGVQMQQGNTSQMIFTVADLIADITSGMTLEPGDVISTGSPPGVGAAMNPPRYLQPGDVIDAWIEQIGTLTNPVKAV